MTPTPAQRRILLVLIAMVTAGCAPTKAYLGPTLPESQLVSVYFSPRTDAEISQMAVDGYEVGLLDKGAQLKPGSHSYSIKVAFENGYCESDGGLDSLRCRTRYASCSGKFESEAGQRYKILVDARSSTVINDSNQHWVASGGCEG